MLLLPAREDTYHLQLVLPELLLLGLVQEWEVADMVNKDIPQDWQFRVNGRNLAIFRSEGRAKALQCRGRVQLGDLPSDLLRDEFPLEI